MKINFNFEEAVKVALNEPDKIVKDPKRFDPKTVEEQTGSGTYSPAGLTAISQDSSKRSGLPPFSNFSDIANRMSPDDVPMGQGAEETEAPSRTPFPLEFVNDYLATSYVNLRNVEGEIIRSYSNPVITTAQKNTLDKVVHKIKTILGNIKSVSDELLKIKLD